MSRILSQSLGRVPGRALGSIPTCRHLGIRYASVEAGKSNDQDLRKKYSATLLLPKTDMPLRAKNPPVTEAKYRARTTEELYRKQVCYLETLCDEPADALQVR